MKIMSMMGTKSRGDIYCSAAPAITFIGKPILRRLRAGDSGHGLGRAEQPHVRNPHVRLFLLKQEALAGRPTPRMRIMLPPRPAHRIKTRSPQ